MADAIRKTVNPEEKDPEGVRTRLAAAERELEVEAALERIRRQAMAMTSSGDLLDIVVTMHAEFAGLGFHPGYFWHMKWMPETYEKSMTSGDGTRIGMIMELPRGFHGVQAMTDWESADDPIGIFRFDVDGAIDYVHRMIETGDFSVVDPNAPTDDDIRHIGGITFIMARTTHGEIGYSMVGVADPEPGATGVLERFAGAFDLAYRRFEDLKKAEAQAREAQIEASLERVRAHALAMQRSDDLIGVVQVIFNELQLSLETQICILIMHDPDTGEFEWWSTGMSAGMLPQSYHIPNLKTIREHPLVKRYLKDLADGTPYSVFELSGETKRSADKMWQELTELRNLPEETKRDMMSFEKVILSDAYLKNGMLEIAGPGPLPDEQATILQRFAKVVEFSYTRMADLQKAEEKAREAQVEVALERVRARTMAMQKSDELAEVSRLLNKEVRELGTKTWGCAFNIYGENESTEWFGTEVGPMPTYPTPRENIFLRYYEKGQEGETLYIESFEGDVCKAHYEYMLTLPVLGDMLAGIKAAGHEFPSAQIDHVAYFKYGYLLFITLEPVPSEVHHVFRRFARVFEQTYTRFLDLKQAEEQARDAQIEAALERVRARAMAMHRSDELPEAANLLFEQIKSLGMPAWSAGYCIWDDDKLSITAWMSSEGVLQPPFKAPVTEDSLFISMREGYEREAPLYVYDMGGEALVEHYKYMRSLPVVGEILESIVDAGHPLPTYQINHCAYFSHGFLLFITYEPVPEAHPIFQRFARVFEQTYTRFLDLKQAEAQAREAQIEAALERIRTQSLRMQHSSELVATSAVFHDQLQALGVDTELSYVWLPDEAAGKHQFWATWTSEEEGEPTHQSRAVTYDLDKSEPYTAKCFAAWESDDPIYIEQIPPDEIEHFFATWDELTGGTEHLRPEFFPDGICYAEGYMKYGCFGINIRQEPTETERDILIRFAVEFERAYARFLDLKQAEARAREAQIEASLERVRSRTMAMHRSEELADIVGKIFEELTALDFALTRCIIWVFGEGNSANWWMANPESESGAESFYVPCNEHPSFQAFLRAWKQEETVLLYTLSGREKVEYDDFLFTESDLANLPEAVQAGMREPEAVYLSNSINAFGLLMVSGLEPLSDQNLDIVQRFGRVFQQSYTRFEDVKHAEAQAREAQIEAALETVRSRSLGMHTSDELGDVVVVIVEKLKDLGVVLDANGVILCTYFPDSRDVLHWIAAPDFSFAGSYLLPYFDHVIFREAWESKESGAEYFSKAYSKEEKDSFFAHAFEHSDYRKFPQEFKEWVFQNDQHILSFAWQKNSAILIPSHTGVTPSDADAAILKRFANVFEQSYVRFLDLKQAEAQARESQIEASLEKVRGRAMGMQKPDDISDVSILMFDEMEALGIESLRSGISIPLEDERYEFHAATKQDDGATTLVLGNESVNVYPIIRRAYDGWKEQEEHQIAILEGEALVEYYHAVFDTMPLPDWQERMKTGAEARECFATFPFADGWLYTFMRQDITDEEIDIHERFARAFGLAYQRYHDLKKAEDDYAALLEEKARTEKALTDLRATQKQLVEQEKLASLGSLTAGIAHEIKNPLNFVNNFAEISTELVEELSEAVAAGRAEEAQSILKEISDNAEQIAKHGKRADSIVKAMMQHARGGSSEPEMINLNEFLEEYINLSWHGMRARDHGFQADVVRRFDEKVGEIQVQPQEMGRVILNLLNNAFDALKGTDPATVIVTSKRRNGSVEIIVEDNGPGIPADVRERIFEPFFTTKPTGEGTGLGLSLSYDIVTKGHGGEMTVGESADGGAAFTIKMPS